MKRFSLFLAMVLTCLPLLAADAPRLADVKSVTIVWADGKTLVLAVSPDGTMVGAFGFGDIRTLQLVDVTGGAVPTPTPPKPTPKPAPKPPTATTELFSVTVLEDASQHANKQVAVYKWLEETFRVGAKSHFNRLDVTDPNAVAFKDMAGSLELPVLFIIGSKADGTDGVLLNKGPLPDTVEATKALLTTKGWKEVKP